MAKTKKSTTAKKSKPAKPDNSIDGMELLGEVKKVIISTPLQRKYPKLWEQIVAFKVYDAGNYTEAQKPIINQFRKTLLKDYNRHFETYPVKKGLYLIRRISPMAAKKSTSNFGKKRVQN